MRSTVWYLFCLPYTACYEGWAYSGDTDYCYLEVTGSRTWYLAKDHCESLNSTLAVVRSQEEMDFIGGKADTNLVKLTPVNL